MNFPLFSFGPRDLAIDLGTANTVVYLRERGVVIQEPSVVALDYSSGLPKVRAVGDDAKLMLGKTPANLRTVRPLRNGVIADIEVAEQMIKHFLLKALGGGRRVNGKTQVVICVPSGSTSVTRVCRQSSSRLSRKNSGGVTLWYLTALRRHGSCSTAFTAQSQPIEWW